MNRLLVICGSTATGKTSLAIDLAYKLNGELVSADSRQVYKYMDVVTGKDLPEKFDTRPARIARQSVAGGISKLELSKTKISYYTDGSVKLWGYDIVRPDQEFSVSHFQIFSHEIIKDIDSRNKLPIVVGGTGLYIKSILEPLNAISFPRDEKLRSKLSKLSSEELFQLLLRRDPAAAISLNNSERNNSRRLIRKLEILQFRDRNNAADYVDKEDLIVFDKIKIFGLYFSDKTKLKDAINARVDKRLGSEMDREIEYLKKKDYLNYAPSRTIGYREWIGHLKGEYSREEATERWKSAEISYAKRQLTWFRKQANIQWFDVLDKDYKTKVEKMAENWHNEVGLISK